MKTRFWEIDFVRGIAVVLMVVFNYAFALDYLHIYTATNGWLFWWLFPRLAAGTFILVAGVSAVVSYQRNKSVKRRVRRGAMIFGWGLLITLVTFIFVPQETVWFGILHLIGLSVMLSPLLIKLEKYNLPVGLAIALIGFYIGNITIGSPLLLWLGFVPYNFATLDYFPVLPWLGVFLVGMYFGMRFYTKGKRTFNIKEPRGAGIINFIGRHSLFIYLIHQILLLFVLYSFGLLGAF